MTLEEEEQSLLKVQGQLAEAIEAIVQCMAECKLASLEPMLLSLLQVQRLLQSRLRKIIVQQMVALTSRVY